VLQLLSQVLSNVPFVVLYLKALGVAVNVKTLMLLAAGSTLAGCITIFGAASNIIILQSAEKRGETLSIKEFSLIGVLTTNKRFSCCCLDDICRMRNLGEKIYKKVAFFILIKSNH
jgi:Na+/H+ antiporter NhaD/arsenite permease-like protein